MSLRWAKLIHEKLAVIAPFAYSQEPLMKMRDTKFVGGWRSLDKFLHEIPEYEATKALIELALYFRTLDDYQGFTRYWKQAQAGKVGLLHFKDGKTEPLSPREMSNKIIHAQSIGWDITAEPKFICVGRDKEAWTRAEIDVADLIYIGGQLGS
jgi:hypothetical protein